MLEQKERSQNETANNIVDFIDLYLITIWLNMQETLPFCKKEKKRRMRILGACIFSKFFGGKITPF